MDKVSGKLTVYFENPFWVGVFERISDGTLSVSKVTFGAEPKDYEIFEFILKNYGELKYSPSVQIEVKEPARNPKRILREARKQTEYAGIGTKSQQALKLQQEYRKRERKTLDQERMEEKKRLQFRLKQQKKKAKHKGK